MREISGNVKPVLGKGRATALGDYQGQMRGFVEAAPRTDAT
jgi:hypothetical protein